MVDQISKVEELARCGGGAVGIDKLATKRLERINSN